jgi:hypothetical protein
MKLSMLKIVLLLAVVVVLVSVSGGIFVQAQTEVDKGPAGSSSGAPAGASSDVTAPVADSGSSALDAAAAAEPSATDSTLDQGGGLNAVRIMVFKRFEGTAFYPRNSIYTYAESGSGGCIYNVANPSGIYTANVHLPQSALVDIVRFFWYDTNASNSTLWLTQYDDHGSFNDLGNVSSSGASGYGDDMFNPNYTVDNYTHSLLLNWRPIVSGSTMQLCAVRLRYWVNGPFWIPVIMKQP